MTRPHASAVDETPDTWQVQLLALMLRVTSWFGAVDYVPILHLSLRRRADVAERGGSETILLVEDEISVRKLVVRSLTQRGYSVLSAGDGQQALRLAHEHAGAIDLVLTDVVMPNVGGPELVATLRHTLPGIRALFMSGYTDDAVMRHGLLEADVFFIQKPYTPQALAQKVREVLDAPHASGQERLR